VAFCTVQSLLQYGFQDTTLLSAHYQPLGLLFPSKVLVSTRAREPRGFQVFSWGAYFHGLPYDDKDHMDQRLILLPPSQAHF
jgi:hypothetical protein